MNPTSLIPPQDILYPITYQYPISSLLFSHSISQYHLNSLFYLILSIIISLSPSPPHTQKISKHSMPYLLPQITLLILYDNLVNLYHFHYPLLFYSFMIISIYFSLIHLMISMQSFLHLFSLNNFHITFYHPLNSLIYINLIHL